jgi:hypothetical protein
MQYSLHVRQRVHGRHRVHTQLSDGRYVRRSKLSIVGLLSQVAVLVLVLHCSRAARVTGVHHSMD